MRVGVPREIKVQEHRVGLTPGAVRELCEGGHQVLVEHQAGAGAGFTDEEYRAAGARIVDTPEALYGQAELLVKVKEPHGREHGLLRKGQVLFGYLHLAAQPELARALLAGGVTAIAYETVGTASGSLPLLAPMSRIAGRMSVQVGAHCLEKPSGGRGVLLGGVPGVPAADVLVLGAGVAGNAAVEMAVGMQADVTVIDKNVERLAALAERYGNRVRTAYSTREAIAAHVRKADLVIGAVLIPGRAAPRLVTAEMVREKDPGSVLVDISIDQGGCFETSRPTSHTDPTYVVDGVVHYCVTNIPGAVPRTATQALVHSTLPYVKALADLGWEKAVAADALLASGLNVHAGAVHNADVAADLEAKHGIRSRAA